MDYREDLRVKENSKLASFEVLDNASLKSATYKSYKGFLIESCSSRYEVYLRYEPILK